MASERHPDPGRWTRIAGWSVVWGSFAALLLAGERRAAGPLPTKVGTPAAPDVGSGRGHPEAPPSALALDDGHEPEDANARAIGLVMVVGVSAIALSITGLFVLLGFLHARDAASQPPLTSEQRAQIAPPGPPLQSSPQYDLASLGALETKKLQGYRWLDPRHSRAQIPIARAMTLVVGKPLDPAP